MILIFDCSAAAKPKNYKTPYTDTFSWPRLIHISWLAYDNDGNLADDKDYHIKPEGFDVSEDMLKYHKVSYEDLFDNGHDLKTVLNEFKALIDKADYIFAFNLKYNESIVGAEFYRKSIEHRLAQSELYCLMQESTYFCKIEGKDGRYKWPTLQELHIKLFETGFTGNNNARQDLIAATACFNELWKRGELEDLF